MLRCLPIYSLFCSLLMVLNASGQTLSGTPADYGRWQHSFANDPNFFPIAVWLQSPRNADRYRQAGINTYVALWKGPTEDQLVELKKAGMSVICSQNEVGLTSGNADVIVAWMHGDEPDNAQTSRTGKGYDPPILPRVIEEDYQRIRQRDPSRPILLNLGQGVAFDDYVGRGVRRNHPEDYPQYIRGSDIVSFDIYPAVHDHPQVAGKLEFVAHGVKRLVEWSNNEKIVWNCIEASRISNTKTKPTPLQIRAEVWMSLIHGSRGLIYFVHQFEPTFKEASLLDDPELLEAVTSTNQQVQELAPVLNSPTIPGVVKVASANPKAVIAAMCKRHAGAVYLFVVNLGPLETTATFQIADTENIRQNDVLYENRAIQIRDRQFEDSLEGYGVHGYKLTP